MGKRTASLKATLAISSTLEQYCVRRDNGTCYYKDDNSDDSIAIELTTRMGENVPATAVSRIRKELFGNLSMQGHGKSVMDSKTADMIVKHNLLVHFIKSRLLNANRGKQGDIPPNVLAAIDDCKIKEDKDDH